MIDLYFARDPLTNYVYNIMVVLTIKTDISEGTFNIGVHSYLICNDWLLVTVTGWYHTNSPMHCGHFLIFCVSPSEF
jgi:hypothetical protein